MTVRAPPNLNRTIRPAPRHTAAVSDAELAYLALRKDGKSEGEAASIMNLSANARTVFNHSWRAQNELIRRYSGGEKDGPRFEYDDEHVADLLKLGGFPITNDEEGYPILLTQDGRPWTGAPL